MGLPDKYKVNKKGSQVNPQVISQTQLEMAQPQVYPQAQSQMFQALPQATQAQLLASEQPPLSPRLSGQESQIPLKQQR